MNKPDFTSVILVFSWPLCDMCPCGFWYKEAQAHILAKLMGLNSENITVNIIVLLNYVELKNSDYIYQVWINIATGHGS